MLIMGLGGLLAFGHHWLPLYEQKTHRDIFQNSLFYIPQKKEGHIGLEQHFGE